MVFVLLSTLNDAKNFGQDQGDSQMVALTIITVTLFFLFFFVQFPIGMIHFYSFFFFLPIFFFFNIIFNAIGCLVKNLPIHYFLFFML